MTLIQYVTATPANEHHVAIRSAINEHVDDGELQIFASVTYLAKNLGTARKQLQLSVRMGNFGVVHAHSSLAGAIVRTAILHRDGQRIVYTPHCFAFDRRDVFFGTRAVYWLIEFILSLNTGRIGACSIRERRSASFMLARRSAVFVPNVAAVQYDERRSLLVNPKTAGTSVAMVGRVSAQKDPNFFMATVRVIRRTHPDTAAMWIGGGDPKTVARMRSDEIEVTGWLAHTDAQAKFTDCGIYIHTAAWEGFPMAVIEANAADLPIVTRTIAAFEGINPIWAGSTPDQMASMVINILGSAAARAKNRNFWASNLSANNTETQREQLRKLYSLEP